MVLLGTRPEAIKMAPVIKAAQRAGAIEPIVCFTGQHKEMAESVLRFFDITPDINMNIMQPGQTLETLTSSLLLAMQGVLAEHKPQRLLVQGDTTTAFVGSLAGFYRNIRVGHVEAGLRTGDMGHPWPEEGNRRLIGALADRHYTPTSTATSNLLRENIPGSSIVQTGNTIVDALHFARQKLLVSKDITSSIEGKHGFLSTARRIVLVTVHRRESFGPGIEAICQAIRQIASIPDTTVVYPVHLNPNVREPVLRVLGGMDNIHLLDPLDYGEFVYMMDKAHLILTDSGGVQEEAPSFGKPVLVMRETSERREAIDAGVAKLVGTSCETIVREASILLNDESAYASMAHSANPFGDGTAADQIIQDILDNA